MGILKHYTWLQTVRARVVVCARVRVCVCVANTQNVAKFLACCATYFGKVMSDDRFCAQSCWITFFFNFHVTVHLYCIPLSITNKMQRYTIFFIIVNALHVSGGETA